MVKTSEKRWCPDCRRVPLVRHRVFWSCPTCGGEMWEGNWIPGFRDEDVNIIGLMQGDWQHSITIKRRSSRSGRRRKKPVKRQPVRNWLDSYY